MMVGIKGAIQRLGQVDLGKGNLMKERFDKRLQGIDRNRVKINLEQ